MTTKKIPCPCGGFVEWKKEKVVQDGVDCGILDVEICTKCQTTYLPEETMLIVEEKLKDAGLWGMERKEIKFWKTGNAISIRIPTSLVKKLNLQDREKGYVYQEGKHKLIIEV